MKKKKKRKDFCVSTWKLHKHPNTYTQTYVHVTPQQQDTNSLSHISVKVEKLSDSTSNTFLSSCSMLWSLNASKFSLSLSFPFSVYLHSTVSSLSLSVCKNHLHYLLSTSVQISHWSLKQLSVKSSLILQQYLRKQQFEIN